MIEWPGLAVNNDISGLAAVHLAWEFLAPPHRVYLPLMMKGH